MSCCKKKSDPLLEELRSLREEVAELREMVENNNNTASEEETGEYMLPQVAENPDFQPLVDWFFDFLDELEKEKHLRQDYEEEMLEQLVSCLFPNKQTQFWNWFNDTASEIRSVLDPNDF